MTVATKPCCACNEEKDLDAFPPDATKALGRASACSRCKQIDRKKARISAPGWRRCQVDGCDLPEFSAGLCEGHYRRKRRGLANALMETRVSGGTIDERFDTLLGAFEMWMDAETDSEFDYAKEAIKFAALRLAYRIGRKYRTGEKKKETPRALDAA